MSSDHNAQGEPHSDTKSPYEALDQYSYLPDQPRPKIMESLEPDASLLELLPDELLVMTIKAFVPAHSSLKYTKSYQEYRTSLHSLCLVSRRMNVFARPALYSDIRLYSYARSIALCATLLTSTQLTTHVKSILFFPYREWHLQAPDIHAIDLRALRQLNDPDFTYWTRGRNVAKVQMPENTRNELVYNLFFKVLSHTRALEALYLGLPHHRSIRSYHVWRQKADAECIQQLDLQHQLFEEFCKGLSMLDLSGLKTVGVLGGEPEYCIENDDMQLFRRILGSPNLEEVFWVQLDPDRVPTQLWEWPLLECDNEDWSPAPDNFKLVSTGVKRISLSGIRLIVDDITGLTIAFPSLESLTIDAKCCFDEFSHDGRDRDGRPMFESLGALENFHTLEFDYAPDRFRKDITTASGLAKLIRLSAMSKLRDLVVPVDFFVDFTSDEQFRIQRTTTLLPDSLRHLTLLLNTQCQERLTEEYGMGVSVTRMVREFLREVAPALLVEFPRLDKVDLCYRMEHYRQNKVHTLAARSTPHAR